jgi:hypothetical protein
MALVFWTSSYVVTVQQLVGFVQKHSPLASVRDGFPTYWAITWFITVKGWHVTEFLVLTLLLARVLRGRVKNVPLWAGLTALLFAISDEFHQTFIPLRDGNVRDVFIDAVGISVALLLLYRKQIRRNVEMGEPSGGSE